MTRHIQDKALMVSILGLNFPFKMYICSCVVLYFYFWPLLPWKLQIVGLHSGIIPFAKCSILNIWQCSKFAFVLIKLINLYSNLMLWTMSDILSFIILKLIQEYSALLRHTHTYWGIGKAYLHLFGQIQYHL